MNKVLILPIIFISISLYSQEIEKPVQDTKKWGLTFGAYGRTPQSMLIYKFKDRLNFTLSLRRRDIRNSHELMSGDPFPFSNRYDSWVNSFSTRKTIAPGVEWFFIKDRPFYITTRIGFEDYQYKSRQENLYYADGLGYTSYRSYERKISRQKIFGELGTGFRYIFWEKIIYGMELGFQGILKNYYHEKKFNDITLYPDANPSSRYTYFYTEPNFRKSWFYLTISFGIVF